MDIVIFKEKNLSIEKRHYQNFLTLGLDTHNKLISYAEKKNLTILSRFKDYYQDIKVSFIELDDFVTELNSSKFVFKDDKDVSFALDKIIELCLIAKEENKNLYAISE